MSDFDAELEEAVRKTGVERYRWLCSDANTLSPPNDAATWRQFILSGRWRPMRDVETILAEAKASGIPEAIEPASPCGGCR